MHRSDLKRKHSQVSPATCSTSSCEPSHVAPPGIRRYEKTTLERGLHPLGVQPLGNLYFAASGTLNARDVGLGRLGRLSDEMVQEILGNLTAGDLVVLSRVSKAFYVFACHEELWKDLAIARFGGDFWFNGTWKKTYATTVVAQRKAGSATGAPRNTQAAGEEKKEEEKKGTELEEQKTIKVAGFYSDFLFQSWYCSSRQIDPGWLITDNVDRRSGLSVEDFIREYEAPNRPVVITDVVRQWPAFKLWTKDYLLKNFGKVVFRAEAVDMTLEKYLQYSDTTTDEGPIYLFDRFFSDRAPAMKDLFEVPPYFREDLFSVVGEGSERPDYRWLIMGPARSGSTFHKDPNSTSAWNAVITGAKKWILYPPEVTPPGVFPSKDGAEVTTSISLMEWFANFYPHTQQGFRPLECICQAGDLMFIPNGWWHTVLNLEESIAITQNYVSGRNLRNVLNFVRECGDQVSGYHGKGSLYDKFVSGLEAQGHANLLTQIKEEEEQAAMALRESRVWDKLKPTESGQAFSFGFDLEDEPADGEQS